MFSWKEGAIINIMLKFSIIIPNWDGKKLLEKNFLKVLTSVGKDTEIIVVDNGSTDGSLDYLQEMVLKNPPLRIVRFNQNYGFAYACNEGVKKTRGDIVVLLNNDVIPTKGFLRPLVNDFSDPSVFAVSFNEPQFSWAKGIFENGFLKHVPGPKSKKTHSSFWASGGSAAFRKRIWQELGGFDPLYYPFYWEDIDLCYRAWKRGYQILWEPRSIVHHQHQSTVSRFSKGYIDIIKQRNELFFIWKNMTSKKLINEHRKFLVKRLVKNPGYLKVILAALLNIARVFSRRLQEKNETKLSDEDIFTLFAGE